MLLLFNAGQQVGGAIDLAVIGSVAWTIVNDHARTAITRAAATGTRAAIRQIHVHALSAGVTAALTIGAAATVLALIVTLATIRVRRADLPDSPIAG
jgi:hypothetical protein